MYNNTENEDGETNDEDETEDSDDKGLWQFRHFVLDIVLYTRLLIRQEES